GFLEARGGGAPLLLEPRQALFGGALRALGFAEALSQRGALRLDRGELLRLGERESHVLRLQAVLARPDLCEPLQPVRLPALLDALLLLRGVELGLRRAHVRGGFARRALGRGQRAARAPEIRLAPGNRLMRRGDLAFPARALAFGLRDAAPDFLRLARDR